MFCSYLISTSLIRFNIAACSASGPPCGKRIVAGRIVKESYGAAKQQHTFTVSHKPYNIWTLGVYWKAINHRKSMTILELSCLKTVQLSGFMH